MPIVDQIDCPHCDTKKSGFSAQGGFRRSTKNSIQANHSTIYLCEDWYLMSCGNCKKCITIQYTISKVASRPQDVSTVLTKHGSPQENGYKYIEHFPKVRTIDIPEYVPEKIQVPFQQALSNISASNWDAAGTMARKTLELTTKDIVRTKVENEEEVKKLITKTWLKKRISALKELGFLTDGLEELAQLIKDEGDGATHDEEPYEENEARELIGYAQALLTYVYTIPGMVEAVKEKVAEDENVANQEVADV
jgi:hypothetical protein